MNDISKEEAIKGAFYGAIVGDAPMIEYPLLSLSIDYTNYAIIFSIN